MVFNKATRGRPPTRAATIPVRRSGSKLSMKRLSSAVPRKSVQPEKQPNQEEREDSPGASRDVRLIITRLADSVIKRHSSVNRGGTEIQKFKVNLNARSVEEILKSVPTLEESPPLSGVKHPILHEYQIPNSTTAGSYASVLTGPVPPDGRDRSAVETVLSAPAPPQELPTKRPSVVSRLLQRTQVNARSKLTKNKGGGIAESPKNETDCAKNTAGRSRPSSVVMLKELEVEYTTSLTSATSAHAADTTHAVTSTDKEISDGVELEAKEVDAGWSLGCVKAGTEACENNIVSEFVSRFTASFCGVADETSVKATLVEDEPLDDVKAGLQNASMTTVPTIEQSPLQLTNNASVPPGGSQSLPSFPNESLKTATEQLTGASFEEEREGGGQLLEGVATFTADPLPTNSILQGEFITPASSPLLDESPGREARAPEGQEETRDEATESTERVGNVNTLTSAEAPQAALEGTISVSKMKIVPLFGFMSGLIGQCYFVSLSPETDFDCGVDALAPEQRLLRFLEAVATRSPNQLAQQDQMAARDLVDSLNPVESSDENALKECPVPEGSAGSIGVLRREGDEYFVDPLPSFNQGGPPSLAEQSTLEYTWDAKASALAAEARSALEKVLLTFAKQPRAEDEFKLDDVEARSERPVEASNHVSRQPSIATVDTDKFLHGTYSWFSI